MPKYIDENGLLYYDSLVRGKISNAVANKVDKESGKALSSNDYTDEEKAKLG